MKQEFNGLLNDICEYLEREEGSYPRRYKRLDPRSLLGRAYTMLERLEDKVHEAEAEEEQRSYPSCTCWRDMDEERVDNDDARF
jgi:hypothetical protein